MKAIHDRRKRCTVKMKKIILYLFTFMMAFSLIGCTKKQADKDTMNQTTQTPPIKETEQPEESPKKSKQEEVNAVNMKNMVRLKGELKVEKNAVGDVDKVLPIYDITPIVLDETILKALEKKGWASHEFTTNEKGGYVITGKEKDKSAKSTLNKKKSLAQAKKFLKDSGIEEILKEHKMMYQTEVSDEGGICIVYDYFVDEDGAKTDAYIRMIFEQEKSCAECVLNLYQSEQIEALPTIPFEKAKKNAFYVSEDAKEAIDNTDYKVEEVRVRYIKGIPYYAFIAYGVGTRSVVDGFALAVDLTKSQSFEERLEQYKLFSS